MTCSISSLLQAKEDQIPKEQSLWHRKSNSCFSGLHHWQKRLRQLWYIAKQSWPRCQLCFAVIMITSAKQCPLAINSLIIRLVNGPGQVAESRYSNRPVPTEKRVLDGRHEQHPNQDIMLSWAWKAPTQQLVSGHYSHHSRRLPSSAFKEGMRLCAPETDEHHPMAQ